MKKEMASGIGRPRSALILIGLLTFILAFTYLSLNLKNVDSGYDIQDLTRREEKLKEEIDKLKSKKASLLNLQRVEKEVIQQLGYQYPEPDQFIKVFEDQNEDKQQ